MFSSQFFAQNNKFCSRTFLIPSLFSPRMTSRSGLYGGLIINRLKDDKLLLETVQQLNFVEVPTEAEDKEATKTVFATSSMVTQGRGPLINPLSCPSDFAVNLTEISAISIKLAIASSIMTDKGLQNEKVLYLIINAIQQPLMVF